MGWIMDGITAAFNALIEWITTFVGWILDGVTAFFDALIAWFKLIFDSLKNVLLDLPILIFEKVLDFVKWALNQFDDALDCCIGGIYSSGQSVQGLFDALQTIPMLGDSMCFFFSNIGLDTAFACLTAGLSFRFMRKLFTLGRW